MNQQTEQISQAPAIDVPVVEVPPPTVIHGSLRIRAVFPHETIVGIPYEQIVQKVYDAIANPQANNPWLPEVSISNLQLWREEVARERPAAARTAESWGIPSSSDFSVPAGATGPGVGTAIDDSSRSRAVRSSLFHSGLGSDAETPGTSGGIGEGSNGPDNSGESEAGGQQWQPTFPTGETENPEGSG